MTSASQTHNSPGLPAVQINALITLRGDTTRTAAAAIGEREPRLSETLTGGRKNERVRVKLCLYLNMPYEALWGGEPNWNAVAAELRTDYVARFGAAKTGAKVAA